MNGGMAFNDLFGIDSENGPSYDDLKNIKTSMELTRDEKEDVRKFIEAIEYHEDKKEISPYRKGQLYERLIRIIFENDEFFKITENLSTPDFEIDFVVQLRTMGKLFKMCDVIPKWIPEIFVIESKNHNAPVKIDYVSKFYGLIESRDLKLGMFISNKGITGRGSKKWENSASLVNKVNLSYLRAESPKILLDFSLKDIAKLLGDNYNIFDLLIEVKSNIFNDINAEIKHKSHSNTELLKLVKQDGL